MKSCSRCTSAAQDEVDERARAGATPRFWLSTQPPTPMISPGRAFQLAELPSHEKTFSWALSRTEQVLSSKSSLQPERRWARDMPHAKHVQHAAGVRLIHLQPKSSGRLGRGPRVSPAIRRDVVVKLRRTAPPAASWRGHRAFAGLLPRAGPERSCRHRRETPAPTWPLPRESSICIWSR